LTKKRRLRSKPIEEFNSNCQISAKALPGRQAILRQQQSQRVTCCCSPLDHRLIGVGRDP
jgi:hypothetical protein